LIQYRKAKGIHVLEMQQLEEQLKKEMLTAQLEIKEETLDNISMEIHDNIGQVLSLARINLEIIEEKSENVDESLGHINSAIISLRSISHLISKNKLEEDELEDLLRKEIEQINRTGKITGTFEIQAENYVELDSEKSFILYRMVQECINNILKHAGAKNVKIVLADAVDGYLFSIIDDGKGYNVKEKWNSNGIQNLKRRGELINAELKINSESNKGTEVQILINHA